MYKNILCSTNILVVHSNRTTAEGETIRLQHTHTKRWPSSRQTKINEWKTHQWCKNTRSKGKDEFSKSQLRDGQVFQGSQWTREKLLTKSTSCGTVTYPADVIHKNFLNFHVEDLSFVIFPLAVLNWSTKIQNQRHRYNFSFTMHVRSEFSQHISFLLDRIRRARKISKTNKDKNKTCTNTKESTYNEQRMSTQK